LLLRPRTVGRRHAPFSKLASRCYPLRRLRPDLGGEIVELLSPWRAHTKNVMSGCQIIGATGYALWGLLAVVGCTSDEQSLNDTTASLPACTWPAGLGTLEAPVSGACTAARVALSCDGSNGGGEDCLSDQLGECPGPDATPGVTYSNCMNRCNPDEYAVSCGGPGPGPYPSPPSGCRSVLAGPGGGQTFCCPCN
jgi:hypothetical protein